MNEKLALLYTLQQLDSTIDVLKRQFGALDTGAVEKAALDAARAQNQQANEALHAVSGSRKDAELEQKAVDTKRQDVETKLYSGKISNPKELQAFQDEVEMLQRQKVRLDEKLVLLAEELEVCQKRATETAKALSEAQSASRAKLSRYKQDATKIADQARLLSAQRTEAQAVVPADLRKRYEAIRANKGGIGIVTVEDSNACGGCKMGLPSSLVKRLQEGRGLETCENCGRILWSGKA